MMKTISRKQARETIKTKGLEGALRIGKTGLTAKQRKFAEGIVLEGLNASDSYRKAYDTKGNPSTVNPHASRLKASDKIQATMQALERAKELAASQSAEALKSLVVSTLVDVATNSDRDSVRVAAVKTLGTVVGVDMFRETKRVEHIKDSDEIRAQILDQLKSMMLSTNDAETVDASDLLKELAPEPHPIPTTPNPEWDSGQGAHSIPHEQPQDFSDPESSDSESMEDPPLPFENDDGGGYISGENDELSK